jgi:alpha-L-rhamnosidase
MHDLAFEAMNKKDKPGYGHWIQLGSTTTREQWDEGGSHNHPMFGGGLTWLYRKLAGMNADPENPGYKHIIFRPMPVGDITSAKYYNQTPFGKAGISWKMEGESFTEQITVPVGCEAIVYVPLMAGKQVQENRKTITETEVIKYIKDEQGYRLFTVASGEYHFLSL